MKWLRRILTLVAILLCIGIAAAMVGIYLFRGTPRWYHVHVISEEERKEVANRADQKMADAISWAAATQAQAVRRRLGTATTNESPIGSKTVTLSEDELNTFFDSWHNPDKTQFQRRLSRYFSDGRLVLVEGELILAGQSKELGTLASVHLKPGIDDTGHLHLEWEGVSAGLLPVPQTIIDGQMQRLQGALQDELAFWQRSADVDQTLTANATAVEAGMTRLLLDAMNDRASNAFVFVPFDLQDLHRALTVRLSAIQVSDGSVTVTLEPLTPDDRPAILGWVRRPYNTPTPQQ